MLILSIALMIRYYQSSIFFSLRRQSAFIERENVVHESQPDIVIPVHHVPSGIAPLIDAAADFRIESHKDIHYMLRRHLS